MCLCNFLQNLHSPIMVAIRRAACAKKPAKEVKLNDNVLDMSLRIGLKGADICKTNIEKLNCLLEEHCLAGLVTLEREDTKNQLHFQMVCKACVKYALLVEILACKYMAGLVGC